MTIRVTVLGLASLAALVMAPNAHAQVSEKRPVANVGPVEIDFGQINIGDQKVVPVTVRNLTTSTMTFAGGGLPGSVGFVGSGGTCGGSLAAGGTCNFNYSFRPRSNNGIEVSDQTSLSVTAGGSSMLVPILVRGRGVGTLVDLWPRTIDFGDTFLGQSVTVPVTVTNRRSATVNFAGGGFNVANGFTGAGGTCGGSLAAGATCNFNYIFIPGALGAINNQTSLSATLSGLSISENYSIQVSGVGVDTVGVVSVHPIAIDFGRVKLGMSALVPIKFTNTSGVQINYAGGGFSEIGSDGGAFSGAIGGGVGCTSSTADVGSTCAINYRLRPYELRQFNGSTSMGFSRPGANQSQPYAFTGTAVGTLAQVSPELVDLGTVDFGTTVSVPVTVFNDGDTALTSFVGGSVASPFSSVSTCTGSLAVGASCTYTYSFTATTSSLGAQTAQTAITFTNAQGIAPVHTITLKARGTAVLLKDSFE
ncbi:choice-of-anchor D domain-containing protein [Ahniella affigens]|nr:choice-of-anchor D domain-containing protein [Ahniella affigens]